MKISILTYGSQGDLEPFVALGLRLSQSGHQVRLAGPAVYQNRFDLGEIEYFPLPGEPTTMVQDLVDEAGTNYFQMVQSVSTFVLPLAGQVFGEVRTASQGADLIIHSFLLTSTGIELGNSQGIPTISAQLFPVFSATPDFPAPSFPDLPLGEGYRRLSHNLVSQTFKWGSRFIYQRVRRKNPSLPQLKSWIPGDRGAKSIPILYGFSSLVVPQPREWKANTHLTGYWLLDDSNSQTPPPKAVDFIRSGPPPITIAFGSTRTRNLEEIKTKLIQALSHCKQRGIIISDQPGLTTSSPDLLQLDYAPYQWLFRHSAAVIHHGGAGTTAKGLMAGVPNIILPFTSDQPFWGRQVHALGAAPQPIPARSLTVKKLIDAIQQCLADPSMRTNAQRIGRGIEQEDGLTQAVKIIEETLKTGGRANI